MEAYLFIYSRLERFDYRLIYAPSQSFLPSPTRDEFISFAREVINTDNVSNGVINSPRWSLIRRGQKVLFGVGIYNKDLGNCSSDIETRNVRGFFGYVFNYEKGFLSKDNFNLSFFQRIFSSYFNPLWHAAKKDEKKINSIIQNIDIDVEECSLSEPVELNTCSTLCKVLQESVIVSDAINSALEKAEIEIVLGLNDVKHVTSANLSKFRNISVIGNFKEEIITITKNQHLTPKKTFDREANISDEFRHKRSKSEDSRYETIYNRLRRCGINVKKFVEYLAKRCGLHIVDQTTQDSVKSFYEKETDSSSQSIIANTPIEPTPYTKDNDKEERKARLSEIRHELATSAIVPETDKPKDTSVGLHTDINNIEELQNLTQGKKDNLDIENLE